MRLTVTEGRYHEVKRLLAAVGHPVLSLKREAMGGVSLDGALKAGEGTAFDRRRDRLPLPRRASGRGKKP